MIYFQTMTSRSPLVTIRPHQNGKNRNAVEWLYRKLSIDIATPSIVVGRRAVSGATDVVVADNMCRVRVTTPSVAQLLNVLTCCRKLRYTSSLVVLTVLWVARMRCVVACHTTANPRLPWCW